MPMIGRLTALRALTNEDGGQIRDVFTAVAERRQVELDDLEAVIQVTPKPAGGDFGEQIAIGGRDDATSALRVSIEPTRCTSPFSTARNSFACPAAAARRLRRERSCRSRRLEQPDLGFGRAGEGPAHVAEELTF